MGTGAVDEAALTAWIAQVSGGADVRLDRVGYGASRATYLVGIGDRNDHVARVDTGDGPMADTELSLAREAEVYQALDPTGVRIPHLEAVSPDGTALLIERAAGTHELTGVDDAARRAIYDDMIDALAELHRVDPSTLALPSYRRPADGPSHALEELALWDTILHERTTRPWPLAHFTSAVLRRTAPTAVAATVVCHGDVGPGNFMHDGSRVTALLDWEFSHVGDPMDDLAWWVFRGHDMTGDCGDLTAQLERWSAATGLAVDRDSIEYYRTFVMYRWLVSVASTLDRGGSGMDRSVHFALVPVLAVRLAQGLATQLGVSLAEAPTIPTGQPGPAAPVIAALGSDLFEVVAPAVQTPEARRRLGAAMLYLSHLDAVDRLGAELWAAELDDVEQLVGRRPTSIEDASALVAELVRQPDLPWDDAVQFFWRSAHRQVALWPLAAPTAFAPATPIPQLTN